MAPKKSKVKKPKVKKRVAQPVKSIIERTICTHPMLKRVQKEVRERKKKSAKAEKIIRYQIVSTHFLHGAFKVLSFVPSLNTLKTFAHYMLCGYKKESGRTFGVFRAMVV